MNQVLDEVWLERVSRLAVGIRVVDGVGGGRPLVDFELALEDVPRPHRIPRPGPLGVDPGIGLPTLTPRRSGRIALCYPTSRPSPLAVRVYDRRRHFVPRRLLVPFPTEAQADDIAQRGRAIAVFPGSGYDLSGTTAIRSRVERPDGTPVRWARVWATVRERGRERVEGVAHADDRGEFALLLRSTSALLHTPPRMTRAVELHVAVPPSVASSPGDPSIDPLATLPVEQLPPPGNPDAVSPGTEPPSTYTTADETVVVTCRLGRVTAPEPFVVS